jgi:hypothetical protein
MWVAVLVLAIAVAMLVFVLWVNRRDYREIETLVQANGQEEEALLARLEQARADYERALKSGDATAALRLGKAYYASKTDYEYWFAPPIPLPDDQKLDPAEREKREREITQDNAALKRRLEERNERLLEADLKGMSP